MSVFIVASCIQLRAISHPKCGISRRRSPNPLLKQIYAQVILHRGHSRSGSRNRLRLIPLLGGPHQAAETGTCAVDRDRDSKSCETWYTVEGISNCFFYFAATFRCCCHFDTPGWQLAFKILTIAIEVYFARRRAVHRIVVQPLTGCHRECNLQLGCHSFDELCVAAAPEARRK